MPAKVLSQEELYNRLKSDGFRPTNEKTPCNTIWMNDKGDVISVNHTKETYPYWYYNNLIEGLKISKMNFSGEKTFDSQTYFVSEIETE